MGDVGGSCGNGSVSYQGPTQACCLHGGEATTQPEGYKRTGTRISGELEKLRLVKIPFYAVPCVERSTQLVHASLKAVNSRERVTEYPTVRPSGSNHCLFHTCKQQEPETGTTGIQEGRVSWCDLDSV